MGQPLRADELASPAMTCCSVVWLPEHDDVPKMPPSNESVLHSPVVGGVKIEKSLAKATVALNDSSPTYFILSTIVFLGL
jgi:hypothetical protein